MFALLFLASTKLSTNVYRIVSLHQRTHGLKWPPTLDRHSISTNLTHLSVQFRSDADARCTIDVQEFRARPVVLKLKRPVVARIATITEWPLILIDLFTEEGIVGHSYLEPYIVKSMRYLVPALQDIGEMLEGRRIVPVGLLRLRRASRSTSSGTRAWP